MSLRGRSVNLSNLSEKENSEQVDRQIYKFVADDWYFKKFACLFLKSLTFSDHEGFLLPVSQQNGITSCRQLWNPTLLYIYSLQMQAIELGLAVPLTVQSNCGSHSSFSVLSLITGINFKEVVPENTKATFGDIHTSIDTLAFTFGNVWVQCRHLISTPHSFKTHNLVIKMNLFLASYCSTNFNFLEFLTSLWEMWTAPQGWGPGEAG